MVETLGTSGSTSRLEDRLVAMRASRPVAPARSVVNDRLTTLARWFDARTEATQGGTALVIQRTTRLPDASAEALVGLEPAAYFDTETTGLSTGAGTVIFMAAVARVDGPRVTVRQYLLPDYPYEPALLRAVAADLATFSRLVTYNGRAFDVPMLAARLTVHGLFREQASLPDVHDDLLPDARRLFRRPLGGARRVAGHPGRGARPQLPGRREPRPAGGRALPSPSRWVARGASPRREGHGPRAPPRGRGRRCARARRRGTGGGLGSDGGNGAATSRVAAPHRARAGRPRRGAVGHRHASGLHRRGDGLDRGRQDPGTPPQRPARRDGGRGGRVTRPRHRLRPRSRRVHGGGRPHEDHRRATPPPAPDMGRRRG